MAVVSVRRAALHSCTIKSVQPGAVSAGHMTQRVRRGGEKHALHERVHKMSDITAEEMEIPAPLGAKLQISGRVCWL